MESPGGAAPTPLPRAFHPVGRTSVHPSFQISGGKSVHVSYVILSLCQLANPLCFLYTYVKCWQPHDSSLFSVNGTQERSAKNDSRLPFPFYFGKGHFYPVPFTLVGLIYTHAYGER